jgi:hypothetical protein
MRSLGDLASASGKPFEQVMSAFAKLVSGQKGEAQMMFQDLLITAKDWEKATGSTRKANGELTASFEDMAKVLPKIIEQKGFAGMMEKQSQTYKGVMSNFNDSITNMSASIGNAFIPLVKQSAIYLTEMTTKIKEMVTSIEGADMLAGIMSNLAGYIEMMKIAFQELGEKYLQMVNVGFNALGKIMKTLGMDFEKASSQSNIFAVAIQTMSIPIRLTGVMINALLQGVNDLITTFQKGGEFFVKLAQGDFKAAYKALDDAGISMGKTFVTLPLMLADLGKEAIDIFSEMGKENSRLNEKMVRNSDEAQKQIYKNTLQMLMNLKKTAMREFNKK